MYGVVLFSTTGSPVCPLKPVVCYLDDDWEVCFRQYLWCTYYDREQLESSASLDVFSLFHF